VHDDDDDDDGDDGNTPLMGPADNIDVAGGGDGDAPAAGSLLLAGDAASAGARDTTDAASVVAYDGTGNEALRASGALVNLARELRGSCGIRWQRGDYIGRGATSMVYSGINLDTGQLIAIKEYLVASHEMTASEARMFSSEMVLMRGLNHPNIVRLLGADYVDGRVVILLEYVTGGSLHDLVRRFEKLEESLIRHYTRQIVEGLAYLHDRDIIHRDIKSANVLISDAGVAKVSDFGASKQLLPGSSESRNISKVGTPIYMSPEVIRGTGHGAASDIWSLGCTVVEMAEGVPPFSQMSNTFAIMYAVASGSATPNIPECLSEAGRDFLELCFRRKPSERPSAEQLLLHPFLNCSRDIA
jgi:serine/threonine protein kinase